MKNQNLVIELMSGKNGIENPELRARLLIRFLSANSDVAEERVIADTLGEVRGDEELSLADLSTVVLCLILTFPEKYSYFDVCVSGNMVYNAVGLQPKTFQNYFEGCLLGIMRAGLFMSLSSSKQHLSECVEHKHVFPERLANFLKMAIGRAYVAFQLSDKASGELSNLAKEFVDNTDCDSFFNCMSKCSGEPKRFLDHLGKKHVFAQIIAELSFKRLGTKTPFGQIQSLATK